MKRLFIILLLPIIATAQERGAIAVMGVIAGISDGQREVIVHNVWAYRYRHPNANELWWNPDSSWRRADKVPQVFVFVSDKYHLNQAIRQTMFLGQTFFVAKLSVGRYKSKGKFDWKGLLIDLAIMQGSYMLAKGATHKFYDVF